jgi:SAM-dependent methyltransferase
LPSTLPRNGFFGWCHMNEYGFDLSRIHHEGHCDLAESAGPAIVSHLGRAGIRRGLVVDLGCGSGILARHLLDSGYEVLGVDTSRAMLQIAKRVAPGARFIRSRAEDVELPTCVAVLATGEALTYVSARASPSSHLRRHIRRVSVALRAGGLFVFDAIVKGSSTPMTYRTWRAAQDWAVLADVTEDTRLRTVTRRITAFARVGSMYRRSYAEHHVGVYARREVLRELRARGFSTRTLRTYGHAPLGPRRLVFHAQLTRR